MAGNKPKPWETTSPGRRAEQSQKRRRVLIICEDSKSSCLYFSAFGIDFKEMHYSQAALAPDIVEGRHFHFDITDLEPRCGAQRRIVGTDRRHASSDDVVQRYRASLGANRDLEVAVLRPIRTKLCVPFTHRLNVYAAPTSLVKGFSD